MAAVIWCCLRHWDQFHMNAAVGVKRARRREIKWRSSGMVRVCVSLAIKPLLSEAPDSFRSVCQRRRGAERQRSGRGKRPRPSRGSCDDASRARTAPRNDRVRDRPWRVGSIPRWSSAARRPQPDRPGSYLPAHRRNNKDVCIRVIFPLQRIILPCLLIRCLNSGREGGGGMVMRLPGLVGSV